MLSDLLSFQFDPQALPDSAEQKITRLSNLAGYFADEQSYNDQLAVEDSVIYQVSLWTVGEDAGDLLCGFGKLMPGKIGDEYFFTKGHYHEWREAAEIYIGLSGDGYMLLEHETNGEHKLLPLCANHMIYVPGYTAHRTINVGTTPLTYIGIYPAKAGHDYGALIDNNFQHVLIAQDDKPALLDRKDYLHKRTSKGIT